MIPCMNKKDREHAVKTIFKEEEKPKEDLQELYKKLQAQYRAAGII